MRRSTSIIIFLSLLSVVAGYLLSHASWVGKVGIQLFYSEYDFLRSWWKTSLLVFLVYMFLYLIQSIVQRYASIIAAKFIHALALLLAIFGLHLSYNDFQQTMSHRLMGERFHIGVYLFWVGWMVISIHCLLQKKRSLEK